MLRRVVLTSHSRPRRYMDRIATALQAVEDRSADGSPVTLLAHSAGGWLSRVFLLEVRFEVRCARTCSGV